jgi:hypothetical protein
MSDTTICPRCGAAEEPAQANPAFRLWKCGSWLKHDGQTFESNACYANARTSQQADPPKDAELKCEYCGDSLVGIIMHMCKGQTDALIARKTVTNAAGGKQSEARPRSCGCVREPGDHDQLCGYCQAMELTAARNAATYPFIQITITSGVDAGKVVVADIYDLIRACGCRNIAQMQAAKKLMRGGRDGKDWARDMKEAADSIQRAIEMEG